MHIQSIKRRKMNPYILSLDRIDSCGHYTKNNIVLCCHIVNTMKNDLDMVSFFDIIQRLYNNKHIIHRCGTEG